MKKILALVCAVLMVLALTACGQTAAPAESAAPAEAPADVAGQTFTVGICQLVQHPALPHVS